MSQVRIGYKDAHHPTLRYKELAQRLISEFAHPSPTKTQPLFQIQRAPGFPRPHVVVVWNELESLSQQERSELVADAYISWRTAENPFGFNIPVTATGEKIPIEALDLPPSTATGLTTQEAERLGMQIEPIEAG